MKKRVLAALAALIMIFAASPSVFSAEEPSDEYERMYSEGMDSLLENLPDSAREFLDKDTLRNERGVLESFFGAVEELPELISERLSLPLTLLASLVAILLLCVLLGTAKNLTSDRSATLIVNLVTSVAVALTISRTVYQLIDSASKTVDAAEAAVTGVVPVFSGLIAATGNITSATLFGFSVGAVSGAATSVISDIITPLTAVILGIGLVSNLYENGLVSLATGLRGAVVWTLGAITSLFITALSLQHLVSGSTDFLMLKTARFFAVSAVPIIGSSVSEAAATIASSIKIIKGTLGSASVITLIVTLLPPIIINILCSLSVSVSVICADVIGLTEPQKCLRTIKMAIDIITAVLVFYLVALVINIAIMINLGG